jgi:hypothetical protein
MARESCGAQEAWEALVDTSQRTNIELRCIAEMLLASTRGAVLPEQVATQLHRSLIAVRQR